jgi:Leu/Phe-tRNA-protein transferase
MFDGAKKCPETNSDVRLSMMSVLHLAIGRPQSPWISTILVKKFRNREFSRQFPIRWVKIIEFCPKFAKSGSGTGINREFKQIS